jgi:hypothetical protein
LRSPMVERQQANEHDPTTNISATDASAKCTEVPIAGGNPGHFRLINLPQD